MTMRDHRRRNTGRNTAAALPPLEAPAITDSARGFDGAAYNDIFWLDVAGATSYDIYRDGSFLYNIVGTSYRDTAPLPTATHGYQVRARDGARQSELSSPVSILTYGPPDATGDTTKEWDSFNEFWHVSNANYNGGNQPIDGWRLYASNNNWLGNVEVEEGPYLTPNHNTTFWATEDPLSYKWVPYNAAGAGTEFTPTP